MENNEILTLEEVAEILSVHIRTVQRRIKDGVLPAFKMPGGQRLYVRKSDLLAALKPVGLREKGDDE